MRKIALIVATIAMFLAFNGNYTVNMTLVKNDKYVPVADAGLTDIIVGNRIVWRIRVPAGGLSVHDRYVLSQQRMNAAVGTFNRWKLDPVALAKPQIMTTTIYQKKNGSVNLKAKTKVTMIAVVLNYSSSIKKYSIEKNYDELELIYTASAIRPDGSYQKKALVIPLVEITAADAAANHTTVKQLAETWLRKNLDCGLAEKERGIYKTLNADHPRYMYELCSK